MYDKADAGLRERGKAQVYRHTWNDVEWGKDA